MRLSEYSAEELAVLLPHPCARPLGEERRDERGDDAVGGGEVLCW